MLTQFICLANSKKYHERCIAGVVVTRDRKGDFVIKKVEGKSKWIRPVTGTDHGQVPAALVGEVDLLDVVQIDIEGEVPNGYQSENVSFKATSLKVVGKFNGDSKNLDLLADNDQEKLFGNKGMAVHRDHIGQVTKSLTLIKVQDPVTSFNTKFDKEQYRLKFTFNSYEYDLPVTDIKFIDFCKSRGKKLVLEDIVKGDTFITISLGVENGEFHSKLVAGIIQKNLLKKETR
jgi:hypothetical protein